MKKVIPLKSALKEPLLLPVGCAISKAAGRWELYKIEVNNSIALYLEDMVLSEYEQSKSAFEFHRDGTMKFILRDMIFNGHWNIEQSGNITFNDSKGVTYTSLNYNAHQNEIVFQLKNMILYYTRG